MKTERYWQKYHKNWNKIGEGDIERQGARMSKVKDATAVSKTGPICQLYGIYVRNKQNSILSLQMINYFIIYRKQNAN